MTLITRRRRGARVFALLAALGVAAARGDGDDPLEGLARQLVDGRAAVERLASQVELKKTAEREALRSSAQQEGDLERQLKALELELEELRRAAAAKAAAVEQRQRARQSLKPLVLRHLDAVAALVREALPFKAAERLAALDELRREVEAERVPADEGLSRLWSSLEDELRLTREVGLHRQRLDVEGQALLCDVAKLGMALMYFRTLDGRLGVVRREGEGWRYAVVTASAEREQLAALFEALDKHIRQGFFVLPNPLEEVR